MYTYIHPSLHYTTVCSMCPVYNLIYIHIYICIYVYMYTHIHPSLHYRAHTTHSA